MMGSESIDLRLENIWGSWLAFRKGKHPSAELHEFQYHLEKNIFTLFNDLNQGTYRHGAYRTFVVCDNKRREVSVASVRDRVVHRLMYDYLNEIYDHTFIYDVWSCRMGKGLLGAIQRAQSFLKKHLKLDLHAKNDLVLKAKDGLRFLRVVLYPPGGKLNNRNRKRVLERLNVRNAGSYSGMVKQFEEKKYLKRFQWELFDFLSFS